MILEDYKDQERSQFMRDLAESLKPQIGPDRGFTLILFDYGPGGKLDYVSTGNRADMHNTLQGLLEHWKAGKDTGGIITDTDPRRIIQGLADELGKRHFIGPHGDCPACLHLTAAKAYLDAKQ